MKRKIGIVGCGHLGQYLIGQIDGAPNLELAFVWNRTRESIPLTVNPSLILDDLNRFSERTCDLIVEVAHPCITAQFGERFLKHCDLMIGSPSALADPDLEKLLLRSGSREHGLYIPSGAFWGASDIKKMADNKTLKGLIITMRKHPSSLKLRGEIQERNAKVHDTATLLYDGPVRQLCIMAPNNVNTMAAAAIAAHNLGFDGCQGRLVSDPSLSNWHYVEVSVQGPSTTSGKQFTVETVRKNPANPGDVTGTATFASFFSSLLDAVGKGPGVHLC